MIILKLRGALGNQMFQYAFGRALSLEKKQFLLIDDSSLATYAKSFGQFTPSRMYRLGFFKIKGLRLPFKSSRITSISKLFGRIFKKLEKIETADPIFDKNLFEEASKVKDIILDGHWISEKYFAKYSNEIRKDFDLKKYEKQIFSGLLKEINDSNSVSLHIRRGDYITNPDVAKQQNIVTLEYFKSAVKFLQRRVKNIHVFVFSDDIDWVKKNLKLNVPMVFMSGDVNNPILDLCLMSKCKHNIIANSTFSWWGAWLNDNKEKIVISPKYWFLNDIPSVQDIVPESWIKL